MTETLKTLRLALGFVEMLWREVHLTGYESEQRDLVQAALESAIAQESKPIPPAAWINTYGKKSYV